MLNKIEREIDEEDTEYTSSQFSAFPIPKEIDVVYYLIHSVFPFVPIPKGYCIETIKERSKEWHAHISNRGE